MLESEQKQKPRETPTAHPTAARGPPLRTSESWGQDRALALLLLCS